MTPPLKNNLTIFGSPEEAMALLISGMRREATPLRKHLSTRLRRSQKPTTNNIYDTAITLNAPKRQSQSWKPFLTQANQKNRYKRNSYYGG